MDEESTGVRDEIGFLTIHQRYADLFFPGTSVLHTRARYALFVPWLFEDLSGLIGPTAQRELQERERLLAGRLRKAGEAQVIGSRVFPKPSSQPPSTVYWNALSIWGILLERPDKRTVSRAQAHRILKAMSSATDDDGQSLHGFDPPFVLLPPRPTSWRSGDISLKLEKDEVTFLRELLGQLRPYKKSELSLLARLVRTEAEAPPGMWSDETRAVAGADRDALERARQVAHLAGIGRAIYDALLERLIERDDQRAIAPRHRDHLNSLRAEYGATASQIDIDALEGDIGPLSPKLRAVLSTTKAWLGGRSPKLDSLLDVYAAAEARKRERARLALTPNGRARRLEWARDDHVLAGPLHYRWEQVSILLNDLAQKP